MDRHDIFFRYNTGWMSGIAYDNRLNTFGKRYVKKNQPFKGFKEIGDWYIAFRMYFYQHG